MDPYDELSDNIDFNTGADSEPKEDHSTDSYDSSFTQESTSPTPEKEFTDTYESQSVSKLSKEDEELERILSNRQARIKVIGCGGAGNNTISRISDIGVTGAEIIAVNTDAQDLLNSNADKKLLLGKDLTQGLGAGSDPQIGKDAAKESQKEIKDALSDAHLVFITGGLGGGTGTGCMPVIADLAKKKGILTVAVVTLPFEMEGV
ncbi:uncharacterized protein METZ01_LOCUS237079, partial [marine metagenome]